MALDTTSTRQYKIFYYSGRKLRAATERPAKLYFDGFFQILRFCIKATCLSITSRL